MPFCPDHHVYPITCACSCLFLVLLVRFDFVTVVVVVVVVLLLLLLLRREKLIALKTNCSWCFLFDVIVGCRPANVSEVQQLRPELMPSKAIPFSHYHQHHCRLFDTFPYRRQ